MFTAAGRLGKFSGHFSPLMRKSQNLYEKYITVKVGKSKVQKEDNFHTYLLSLEDTKSAPERLIQARVSYRMILC